MFSALLGLGLTTAIVGAGGLAGLDPRLAKLIAIAAALFAGASFGLAPGLLLTLALTTAGDLRPASVSSHTRRTSNAAGMPAGGGRAVGFAHHRLDEDRLDEGRPPEGAILVTRHLEPQLAPVLGGLVGLMHMVSGCVCLHRIPSSPSGCCTSGSCRCWCCGLC